MVKTPHPPRPRFRVLKAERRPPPCSPGRAKTKSPRRDGAGSPDPGARAGSHLSHGKPGGRPLRKPLAVWTFPTPEEAGQPPPRRPSLRGGMRGARSPHAPARPARQARGLPTLAPWPPGPPEPLRLPAPSREACPSAPELPGEGRGERAYPAAILSPWSCNAFSLPAAQRRPARGCTTRAPSRTLTLSRPAQVGRLRESRRERGGAGRGDWPARHVTPSRGRAPAARAQAQPARSGGRPGRSASPGLGISCVGAAALWELPGDLGSALSSAVGRTGSALGFSLILPLVLSAQLLPQIHDLRVRLAKICTCASAPEKRAAPAGPQYPPQYGSVQRLLGASLGRIQVLRPNQCFLYVKDEKNMHIK